VLVGGPSGGPNTGTAPVTVIRGVAGPLDISKSWAGDDEETSVAFLPVGQQGGGPYGPPGLLFAEEHLTRADGNDRVLQVEMGGAYLNVVVKP
jgi:hypothetical protein